MDKLHESGCHVNDKLLGLSDSDGDIHPSAASSAALCQSTIVLGERTLWRVVGGQGNRNKTRFVHKLYAPRARLGVRNRNVSFEEDIALILVELYLLMTV